MRERSWAAVRSALVSTFVRLLSPSLAAATVATTAAALPAYEILPLGFTDAEHTSSVGYRFTSASLGDLTASGYVSGSSARYNGGPYELGYSAWIFDLGTETTTRLGYIDAAHTRNDGYQISNAHGLTESGYVSGTSERYSPEDSSKESSGGSAWLYDAHTGTTTRLGYFDAVHTAADGFQRSSVIDVNESGYALGTSQRYAGASSGLSAWLYDAGSGTTTRLGYFDAAHTQFDGSQSSNATMLTQSGYAIGSSTRKLDGSSAWLYDAGSGTTTRLGYYDAAHTRYDGSQYSVPTAVTESGDVIGNSLSYVPAYQGQSAWYYDSVAGTTTRMGLVDAAHTRSSDGYQSSSAKFATESGYAVGTSQQNVGAADRGRSAWLFDSSTGTTSRMGFFDLAHTREDGRQFSDVLREPTDSGYVIGSSLRYNGGAVSQGSSAWIYDAGAATTTRLGYFDAAHTGNNGYQSSLATSVTESGYVTGNSERFNGAANLGRSEWLFDAGAATTTRLGYFDAAHTRSDGYQFSDALLVTESGYAAGRSFRYEGGTAGLGVSSWIYSASDQSQDIILLSERSDGYADSLIFFLGEDGLALGRYQLFAEDDTSLGYRAFAWTPDDGAVDLGALVMGGLTAEGWDHLESAIRANGLAQIVGSGRLESGGDLAYLLVAIPEPGTGLLVAIGLSRLAARRRMIA